MIVPANRRFVHSILLHAVRASETLGCVGLAFVNVLLFRLLVLLLDFFDHFLEADLRQKIELLFRINPVRV